MVYVIALGVAIFTIIGYLRIVVGYSMRCQLTVIYTLMLLLTLLTPEMMIPLAYDAGSVTTGALAGPVVLAVGLGVSSVIGGRSTMDDAFGLLAVASIGPIIVILTMGWLMT